jgi:glycosyltransferase involved in cell wall biosynthesis
MRILQVCNTDFYLNGFLKPLVFALVDEGFQVECVCEGEAIDPQFRARGIVIHQVPFPRAPSPWGFASTIAKLRRIIARGRFDCVNSHNRNASIAGRIAAKLERVPCSVYTAHGFYFHDDQGPLAREALILLEAGLARITDFTLSQTEEDKALMTRRGHIPSDRISVIANGIDHHKFRPRDDRLELEQRLDLEHGKFRVGAIGRIVSGKGFIDLLEAFARLHASHSDARLLLIGGNIRQDISPYATEFEARVRTLGLSGAVAITGMTDQVPEYLATCDLFVHPSYREGLPRVVLEAMAAGVPVIATDIRGCREAVVSGQTGFLYPPRNVEALIRLLEQLHRTPAGARRAFGACGRQRVLERFTEEQYVSRQVAEISSAIETARNLARSPSRPDSLYRRIKVDATPPGP